MKSFRLWKETVSRPLDWFPGATPCYGRRPALLGVGYIIGTRISCIMVAGGILAYFVLIPAIKFFGDGLDNAALPGHDAHQCNGRRANPRQIRVSTSAPGPWPRAG